MQRTAATKAPKVRQPGAGAACGPRPREWGSFGLWGSQAHPETTRAVWPWRRGRYTTGAERPFAASKPVFSDAPIQRGEKILKNSAKIHMQSIVQY